jgi:isopentenyl-diphosphate delta-isomerase
VIVVDQFDNETGSAEKLEAHSGGILHRAFSIFVFNSDRELLLQKRAQGKYHSGGLWSNSCCGHPRPGEETRAAAKRRLREELNLSCDLQIAFEFLYRVELDNSLIEHEYDHVFIGTFDGLPEPDKSEVEDWKWVGINELIADLELQPDRYTFWLSTAMKSEYWQQLESVLSSDSNAS